MALSSGRAAAAPIVSAEPTTLRFGDRDEPLECVYVHVDGRSRQDVADFLSTWRPCCDNVAIDWQSVRRPQSALVGLELQNCCGDSPASLRLVFDVRRDREALEALARTEALVVGTRGFGRFANSMAAYGVDGALVRDAVAAAESGLKRLTSVTSIAS